MRIRDWSSDVCSSDLVESRHSLEGQRWGRVYRLGDRLRVRLVEATPMTGGLILALDEAEGDAPARDAGSRAGSREGGADRRPRGTARKKAQGPASSKKADESRTEEHTSELQSLMRKSHT